MIETFRPPMGVRNEAQSILAGRGHCDSCSMAVDADEAQGLAQGLPVSLHTIVKMRSWHGEGREWSRKIMAVVASRTALLNTENPMNPTSEETRDQVENDSMDGMMEDNSADTTSTDADNSLGEAVLAADAANDATQALLKTLMDSDPVIAQAYYLAVAADSALGVIIDAMGLSDPDDDEEKESADPSMENQLADVPDDSGLNSADERAAAARIGEGTFVSWDTKVGRGKGKVEKVTTRGQATSSEGYTLEATPQFPVYSVRIFNEHRNGWIPTETVSVHRNDYLTVIKPLPAPRSEDMSMVEERKSAIATAERITMSAEVRASTNSDGSIKISGYAATFNQESTGLNFREVIAPGAFTRTLASDNPVFLLINHDTDQLPLASTQSGTLTLTQDDKGLRMDAVLDPKNPRAAEVSSVLDRGDVDKMSFAFTVAPNGDSTEAGLRTLTDLNLFEVSIVTWPAYDSTTVAKRSAEEAANDLELRRRQLQLKLAQIRLR